MLAMASEWPASACSAQAPESKCKRTSQTLEMKLEVLHCCDAGKGPSALGWAVNLGVSTIRNIKKNADKILSAVAHSMPFSAKITMKVKNPLMEKMLLLYIEHETKKCGFFQIMSHLHNFFIFASISDVLK